MNERRKSYPSDVSDEEWDLCARYLTLMAEAAPQRAYPLREIFNVLRYLVRMAGAGAGPQGRAQRGCFISASAAPQTEGV